MVKIAANLVHLTMNVHLVNPWLIVLHSSTLLMHLVIVSSVLTVKIVDKSVFLHKIAEKVSTHKL